MLAAISWTASFVSVIRLLQPDAKLPRQGRTVRSKSVFTADVAFAHMHRFVESSGNPDGIAPLEDHMGRAEARGRGSRVAAPGFEFGPVLAPPGGWRRSTRSWPRSRKRSPSISAEARCRCWSPRTPQSLHRWFRVCGVTVKHQTSHGIFGYADRLLAVRGCHAILVEVGQAHGRQNVHW